MVWEGQDGLEKREERKKISFISKQQNSRRTSDSGILRLATSLIIIHTQHTTHTFIRCTPHNTFPAFSRQCDALFREIRYVHLICLFVCLFACLFFSFFLMFIAFSISV